MPLPQRIVILGNAGSGKSTLARKLGAALDLPVVHLDRLFWNPGWQECETEEFRRRVLAAMQGERWITEGNYSSRTWDLRLPRADLVLRLVQPTWLCLGRAIRRSVVNYGRTRADLGPACPEKFDPAFWRFIWNYEKRWPRSASVIASYALGARYVELRGDRAIADFVNGMQARRA